MTTQVVQVWATQTRIIQLDMYCRIPQCLHALVSFASLKSLAIEMLELNGPLSLAPLCASIPSGLQLQLSKLTLDNLSDVSGLDLCLAHHPLQELQLRGVYFLPSLAPSMRLASQTLKILRVSLNLTYPEMSAANFPALHTFQLRSFQLKHVPGVGFDESLRRAHGLASSVAGFPCLKCISVGTDRKIFTVRGTGWSSLQLLELLEGLAPLRPALQSLTYLMVVDANVGCGTMRCIASLFPALKILNVISTEPGHTYTDHEGLVAAISGMPRLQKLKLRSPEAWPPRDINAALLRARVPDFVLEVESTNVECLDRLESIRQNWEMSQQHSPDQCRAILVVVASPDD